MSAAACRSCGSPELEVVLSLGRTPLANSLLTEAQLKEPEPTYPLDLVFCPRCTLVQITAAPSPEKLFREYFYFSSVSETLLRHAAEIAGRLVHSRSLNRTSFKVLDLSAARHMIKYLLGQFARFFLRRDFFQHRILSHLLLNQLRQFKRSHLQHLDALTQLWRQHETLGKTGSKPN